MADGTFSFALADGTIFLRICRMAYAEMPEWHILARRLMAKCHSGTCSIINREHFPQRRCYGKGQPWQAPVAVLQVFTQFDGRADSFDLSRMVEDT